MSDFPRLNFSSQSRDAFNDLLTAAPKLGLDPERVVAAGLPGLRALLALKRAAESGSNKKRDTHLAQLQSTLRVLQYRRHPELVQQLQARAMALQGRGGDTEVAHVTVGEIVLPRALQTPAVLGALHQAAVAAKIPVNRLRVGSSANSINPRTGAAEFAAAPPTNPPHVDAFFDTYRDRITGLANEMGVPPNFMMGLAIGEGGWDPSSSNNPFGISGTTEQAHHYPTIDAGIDAFRNSQWYSRLRGKTDAGEFVDELLSTQDGKNKFNTANPNYGQHIHGMIGTINRRLPIWEQRP